MTAKTEARVLHVVESYGAGVASAVHEYVAATPGLEHHILRRRREDSLIGDTGAATFATVTDLPSGVRAIPAVRRALATVRPTVVHAHSSRAGVYVRLALRNGRGARIVYTPHCFAFERRDVSWLYRAGCYAVERCLAVNTAIIAGCSRREADIGRRWLGAGRTVYVPNVARVGNVVRHPAARPADPPVAVGMGRVCAQKDPSWFADAMAELRTVAPAVRAVWLGGGGPDGEAVLRRSGVEVTQWSGRTEALEVLARADCYLHSAAWEGFPMSVLEAVELGVPVVMRGTPSVPATPPVATASDPAHAAQLLGRVLTDSAYREANLVAWRAYLRDNNGTTQSERLTLVYQGRQHAGPGRNLLSRIRVTGAATQGRESRRR